MATVRIVNANDVYTLCNWMLSLLSRLASWARFLVFRAVWNQRKHILLSLMAVTASFTVLVKWLAVKTVSKMTVIVTNWVLLFVPRYCTAERTIAKTSFDICYWTLPTGIRTYSDLTADSNSNASTSQPNRLRRRCVSQTGASVQPRPQPMTSRTDFWNCIHAATCM